MNHKNDDDERWMFGLREKREHIDGGDELK